MSRTAGAVRCEALRAGLSAAAGAHGQRARVGQRQGDIGEGERQQDEQGHQSGPDSDPSATADDGERLRASDHRDTGR